ncbi:MAG: LD-carboxypeptidase [Flavobacteriales bacterium]|nr:LD-carboxypeptidase [Flavobacteriales bacterium]
MNKFLVLLSIAHLFTGNLRPQDSFQMDVIRPSFLKSGDTIAVVSTARWISEDVYAATAALFSSWGFKTKRSENLFTRQFQLAGDAKQRRQALQDALDDPEVKAIVIARGGYGTVHIIDELDFSHFRKNPKWICGYSDITVLHAHCNSAGIATIHSTMPVSFGVATPEALETLRQALTGELNEICFGQTSSLPNFPTSPLPVLGGNLSVLDSLLGSGSINFQQDHILFIEDVDEMFYHIDRLMMALKRAGVFRFTKAILLGGMTQMKDNTTEFGFETQNPWGHDPRTTVFAIANSLNIPVLEHFPAGHQNDNRAFYLNVPIILNKRGQEWVLTFQQS